MTDGWVDVYPLDECTAFYRQELDTLYTAATLAQASTQNAHQWVNRSLAVAAANCHRAPLSYPALGYALYGMTASPTGLISLAAGTVDLAESLSTAREVYAEAEWTLARTIRKGDRGRHTDRGDGIAHAAQT